MISFFVYVICAYAQGNASSLAPLKGELAGPRGLTCAPAGAMQASNRRQAALSESQRGSAVGSYGFMKSQANSYNPTWLPGGGAGRPNGLTEGVWFVEWLQLKVTNVTPFAAIAALPPKGAARSPYEFGIFR